MRLSTLYHLYGSKIVDEFLRRNPKYRKKGEWVGSEGSLRNLSDIEISEKKIKIAKSLAGYFHLIPWIRFAAISGSVSFGSADKNADIDIFLVVAKNRLWITRGLEELLFNFLGVRKVMWKKGTKNKLCINFYTSEDNLSLDFKKRYRLLTSLEIAMMKPIFNENYYDILLSKNRWIGRYFPNLKMKRPRQNKLPRVPVIAWVFDLLDLLAMGMQIGFMKLMGHSTENSTIRRNRITFFDENEIWEGRQKYI